MDYSKRLARYLAQKGHNWPYVLAASERATNDEQLSLTACIMSELLGQPLDDCVDFVNECVSSSDEIDFNEIENYIIDITTF